MMLYPQRVPMWLPLQGRRGTLGWLSLWFCGALAGAILLTLLALAALTIRL